MDFDKNINRLVYDTMAKSARFKRRMHELVALLYSAQLPSTGSKDFKITASGAEYDFDDILVMVFELVQLLSVFGFYPETEMKLKDFLTIYSSRLIELCIEGRLTHTDEIVEFKNVTKRS